MATKLAIRDEAMRAFISTLSLIEASAPTWCTGWSAHELTAHIAAAAEERADLIDECLAGKSSRPTRSWEMREPPFRAMPDVTLRQQLVQQAVRFESSVAALDKKDTIVYTGWAMNADRLRMHSHSEAVLHRWDLVGDDKTSIRLLSDPAILIHAYAVFDAIPALPEAQRWKKCDFASAPIVLRANSQPDVVLTPGSGLSLTANDEAAVIHLEAYELPLLMWGRCPSRLRDPDANAETIENVLRRLARQGR